MSVAPSTTTEGVNNSEPVHTMERKRTRAASSETSSAHRDRSVPMACEGPSPPPPSTALLSRALKNEMRALLTPSSSVSPSPLAPLPTGFPSHKVGALEMYHRFPGAYDLFMRRHDCSAIERFLVHESVLPRILASADVSSAGAPAVRVADFGCGTGRIACMVVPHRAVRALYAYDLEVPMLKRCLVNVAAKFREHRLRPEAGGVSSSGDLVGIRLLPEASDVDGPVVFPETSSSSAQPDRPAVEVGGGSSPGYLDMCLRPCPFQLIQAGFLRGQPAATTPATSSSSAVEAVAEGPTWAPHPRVHLVVCAWSLSFVMRLQWGESHWHAAVDSVVDELFALLDNSVSDAALVIIETLGNLSPTPTRQNTLMERLETVHGFTREWVRTDYTFQDVDEAVKMTQFFFGGKMSAHMAKEQLSVLMECTGIWVKWKPKQT